MTIRAVLFDLDGTLIDSLDDLTDAVNYMMDSFGRRGFSRAEVRGFIGKGARNLVCRALVTDDPTEIESGLARFLEYNRQHIVDKSRLYPGVRETLEVLAGHGISLAAVSNKNEALSRLVLEALGIDSFFRMICGADTFEEMKPSPLPLLRVLDRLAVSLEDAVMVGDSSNDIQAGIRAGMTTVACSWGYGEPEELLAADYLAASCPDVAGFLLNRAR